MEIKIKDGDEVKIVHTPIQAGKKVVQELVEDGHAETDENGTVVVDVAHLRAATASHMIASLPHLGNVSKMGMEEYSPYPKPEKPKRRARNNSAQKWVASEKKREKRLKRKKQAKKSQKRNRK